MRHLHQKHPSKTVEQIYRLRDLLKLTAMCAEAPDFAFSMPDEFWIKGEEALNLEAARFETIDGTSSYLGTGITIKFQAHPALLSSKRDMILSICKAAEDTFFVSAQRQQEWLRGYLRDLLKRRGFSAYWFVNPDRKSIALGGQAENIDLDLIQDVASRIRQSASCSSSRKNEYMWTEDGSASHLIRFRPVKFLFEDTFAFGELSLACLFDLQIKDDDVQSFCHATNGIAPELLRSLLTPDHFDTPDVQAQKKMRKLRKRIGVESLGELAAAVRQTLR